MSKKPEQTLYEIIKKEVLSYNALTHAISGTVGGFTAMSTFYPLDNIRTFLQVEDKKNKSTMEAIQQYFSERGVAGLYAGLSPVLFSLACSNFVYFYSYNLIKSIVKKSTGEFSVSSNLITAAIAGCINVLTTCPLWVVNTRIKLQKTQKYDGIVDGLIKISKEEGVGELWNGTLASLVLVSNPTIQFFAYDKLKVMMENYKNSKNFNSWEIFFLGAIAKLIATILTYPLQIAQSRLRALKRKDDENKKKNIESKEEKQERYLNTFDCLLKIFQKDGFLGWFTGLDIKILQTVLTAAFQFLVYEKIHTFMLVLLRNSDVNKKN